MKQMSILDPDRPSGGRGAKLRRTARRSVLPRLWLVLCVLLTVGSLPADSAAGQDPPQKTTDEAWVEIKNGLRYLDLEVGEGEEATSGQTVQVHYTGWLTDGTQFQSSRDSGSSFVFDLGRGQVIAGWDKGLRGMRAGGKRKLEIPAKMAYGKRGRPGVIPPNATLIFEIELLSVR